MKLLRIGPAGNERLAVLAPDDSGAEQLWDAAAALPEAGAVLSLSVLARIRATLAANELPLLDASVAAEARIGSPIPRPGNIICVGMNYAAHAAESGAAPPEIPVLFLKPPNTAAGPYDAAPIPPLAGKYDWEVELGVVIGAPLSYATDSDQAMAAVAGYLVANDLSEREYQIPGAAGQWTKGKSLPASTPLGPWLVPADEVDVGKLRLRSWVNGELRQDSNTADMIFDVPTLVHHVSQYMLLEPGDLILTGTPEGVALSGRFPYLAPGDVVEMEIEELGRMGQEFYRAGAVPPRSTPAASLIAEKEQK